MSRKQSAYLQELLSDVEDDAPLLRMQRRASLLERENSLARLASGEVRQVAELRLDPARCRIWPGNGRYYASLNEDACRDLIDSMIAENGQRVPAIVRHVKDDPEHDFEVIAGTRRYWTVAWLRANSYPDITFLAQVQDIDDEAAFRLADLENRARQDLSDIERARSYREALGKHYGGVQTRMAERLRISKGWLTKLLALASLPDEVVAAYPFPAAIQVKGGYELVLLLQQQGAERNILDEAALIGREQEERRGRGDTLLTGPEVTRRLVASASRKRGRNGRAPILSSAGRPLISVVADRSNGLTIRIHADSGANKSEMLERLGNVIATARLHGTNRKE
jgi:ParB family chromosome partitioning protein